MSAPTMEERKACWGARDELWQCLDRHTEDDAKCKELRLAFEARCPQQWCFAAYASVALGEAFRGHRVCDTIEELLDLPLYYKINFVHSSENSKAVDYLRHYFHVKYFDRRRDFLKYKKKLETEGYHPPEAAGKS